MTPPFFIRRVPEQIGVMGKQRLEYIEPFNPGGVEVIPKL
jgi:hypothetical protein